MHVVRRRTLRAACLFVFLVSCTLTTSLLGHGLQFHNAEPAAGEPLSGPRLNLLFARQSLRMTITSTSTEHEESILGILREQFSGMQIRVDFQTGLLHESGWNAASAELLRLIATMNFAEASMANGDVRIRGVSNDAVQYRQRLEILSDALPNTTEIQSDVLLIAADADATSLCTQSFHGVAVDAIKFRQSSTEFRQSAYPALDRLVEFTYDCPATSIAIIGHTDATGEEAWNLQLSRARAEAVASYLASNGIAAANLTIEGRGSSEPVGDNGTVVGREKNRRIELEIR